MGLSRSAPKLFPQPLAVFERDGLAAALAKAGLPTDDVPLETALFWRFVTDNDVPAGFGGLEMHGRDALLHSLVILPPLRRRRIGAGTVALLETEARVLGAHAVWLVTERAALFFERLDYSACPPSEVPEAIRASPQFRRVATATATTMTKRLG